MSASYLVCYDITSDKSRAMAAACLLDSGVRVQESVFECALDEAKLLRLMERLQRIPLQPSDRVRVYHLCRRCAGNVVAFGPVPESRPDFYLI